MNGTIHIIARDTAAAALPDWPADVELALIDRGDRRFLVPFLEAYRDQVIAAWREESGLHIRPADQAPAADQIHDLLNAQGADLIEDARVARDASAEDRIRALDLGLAVELEPAADLAEPGADPDLDYDFSIADPEVQGREG